MEKGKISNKPAPAVIIDIDGLVIEDSNTQPEGVRARLRRWLDRRSKGKIKAEVDNYKLIDTGVIALIENLLYTHGVYIILFAHREKKYKPYLEEYFDNIYLPYSKLSVGGRPELELILNRQNVKWYFYKEPEHSAFLPRNKGIQIHVSNWKDIDLT